MLRLLKYLPMALSIVGVIRKARRGRTGKANVNGSKRVNSSRRS